MMKLLRTNLARILSWVLFFAWFSFSFYLSSQNGTETSNLSTHFVGFLLKLFHFPVAYYDIIHIIIRHFAHILVFFILSFLLYFAFTSLLSFRQRRIITFTVAICSVLAVFDEVKKIFIVGRHCQISDILLNWAGICLFIIFITLTKLAPYIRRTD